MKRTPSEVNEKKLSSSFECFISICFLFVSAETVRTIGVNADVAGAC